MSQMSQDKFQSLHEGVFAKDIIRSSIDSDFFQPEFQVVQEGDEKFLIRWLQIKGALYLKEALFSNCAQGVYRLELEDDILKIAGSKEAIAILMGSFNQKPISSSNYYMRGIANSDHIEVLFGSDLHETALHILLSLMNRGLVEESLPILPIGDSRVEFRAYFQARNNDTPRYELMLAKKSKSDVVGNVSSGGTYIEGENALAELSHAFALTPQEVIELAIASATETAQCYVGTGLCRTAALQIPESPILEQGLRDFAVDFVPLKPGSTKNHFGLIEVQPLPDLDIPLRFFPDLVSGLHSNRKTLESQAKILAIANRLSFT